MTEKELKRMSRQELLDELYSYANENAELHLRLENIEEQFRQHLQKVKEELVTEQKKTKLFREKLRAQEKINADLKEKLGNRSVVMEDAGNIAEATCKITGIFEEAQKTANLYVKNVMEMAARQEKVFQEMEEKSRQDIQKMGDEASRTCIAMRKQTEKECAELERKTEAKCREMEADAFANAEAYWEKLHTRLENFYEAHQGMRELFGSDMIRIPSFKDSKRS